MTTIEDSAGPGLGEGLRSVTCAKCQHENEAVARVCAACGEDLFVTCLRCGRENPRAVNVCAGCGRPLRRKRAHSERRRSRRFALWEWAVLLGGLLLLGMILWMTSRPPQPPGPEAPRVD
jgi:predicted amidophosphoribosyltransferase